MAGGFRRGLKNNCSPNCRPCCRPYHTGLFALLSVCLSVRLSVCFVSFSVRSSVCMYGCLLVYCVSVWDLPLTTNNEMLKWTTPNVGKFVITFKIKIPPCTLSQHIQCEVCKDIKVHFQVDIICGLLDIPRYRYRFQFFYLTMCPDQGYRYPEKYSYPDILFRSRIQSLHVLFTLYSAFTNSQHFNQLARWT